MGFARRALGNKDIVGVLFVIKVDPSTTTTPFASIDDVSFYGYKENEVLFSMHTVFRVCAIKPIDKSPLYQVELTLTSDNDKDCCELTDRIRKRTEGSTGWGRLGQFLLSAGQPGKAEEVYKMLLVQSTEVSQREYISYQLGSAKYHQGKYLEAIESYQETLKIQQQSLSPNHPSLAKTYNRIGNAYSVIGQHSEALSSHKKALKIQEQSLPPNHLDFALSYDSIGSISYYMSKYSEALPFHENALRIRQMSLCQNHPELAMSYNNIGMVHRALGRYSTALSFYERAVHIGQCSLPPNHPHLQMYKKKLDAIKELM